MDAKAIEKNGERARCLWNAGGKPFYIALIHLRLQSDGIFGWRKCGISGGGTWKSNIL